MPDLAQTEETPFIRTNFDDDADWAAVIGEVVQGYKDDAKRMADLGLGDEDDYDESLPDFAYVDDRAFEGADPDVIAERIRATRAELARRIDEGELDENRFFESSALSTHTHFYVYDAVTTPSGERTVLVVDVYPDEFRSFRTVPAGLPTVEDNLFTQNLGFDEFAEEAAEAGGVYRG